MCVCVCVCVREGGRGEGIEAVLKGDLTRILSLSLCSCFLIPFSPLSFVPAEKVAIKVMRRVSVDSLLEHEARVLRHLRHPNIITLFQVERVEVRVVCTENSIQDPSPLSLSLSLSLSALLPTVPLLHLSHR